MKFPRPKTKSLFAVFFWLFNLSLLLVVSVTLVLPFGRAIIDDALQGLIPLSIIVPVLGLVGVPTTSTAMGIRRRRQLRALKTAPPEDRAEPASQRQPITLYQIFFGIEAPLLMACTIRLFFLRDLTPVSTFVFISIALGTAAFAHGLLTRHPQPSGVTWGHLAGATLMLALSVYLSTIALFYALPIFVTVCFAVYYTVFLVVLLPIFFPFAMLFTGLVIMPWGMVALYLKTWRQTLQQLSERRGHSMPRAFAAGTLALWLGGLLLLQQQPQTRAFDLLDSPPQSDGDRQALVQQSEVIRGGLLNAYLAAYRYPLLNHRGIYQTYSSYLKFPEGQAEAIQAAYSAVLTPFTYHGTADDKDKAERLYAAFFDTPILRGEHEAIQKAVLSNFNRTQAKAGLLDIGAERVRLQRQELTVTPQGDWAEIELHETYANTTLEDTEILYYFSLPESATVTGLWLGETGDRAQRYEYVVAPRGAAQQVYNDQVQRRVDPALLEQVGPRNYRLRAFPIPPAGQDRLPEDGEPDKMHLWMTYKVMQQDGQWPLPQLSEQRNIFWTERTQRIVNGKAQRGSETWLPASLPVASESDARQTVQAALPAGYVVAQPLDAEAYQLPQGQRLAFILDGSYSMDAHRKAFENSLQWLKDSLLDANAADLYLTRAGAAQAEKVSSLKAFDPKQAVFYGAMQPRQMLAQYQQAIAADSQSAASRTYDAIVLLTDSGSYELTEDADPVALSAPLWLVHLGGFQAAYDDATLETIQSTGGSTAASLETAMARIATQPSLGEGTSLLNVVDGYAWYLSRSPYPDAATVDTLAPIAARQWVAQVSQAVKPDQLSQLDAIHQVAKENSIVTPYSSMLVLVNSEQKQQLKEAEAGGDRFDREVEDQQLPDPQNATVSAVPEPEEWLLLLAGLAVLGLWYVRRAWTDRAVDGLFRRRLI
ncbi:MAG: TIGR02921 family PEP-CTERM protein [Elainellaceae cyanobacterium]